MKHLFLLLLFILFCLNVDAQNLKSCNAHEHYNYKISNDLSLKLSYERIQKEITKNIERLTKEQSGDTLIIPVVFQIIHNGDMLGVQENISEDLILEQLQQINDDFSRQNADAINTPPAFLNVAADTEIQFCLASVDPTGAFTSGIVRTHINSLPNVDESDCWTADYIDDNIITPLIWDRDNYLNIFSVIGIDKFENGACAFFNTLGYAQFPGGAANTDAVTLAFYTVGSLDMPNPLLQDYMGRTCSHEIGHWLNLFHLWGPSSGGCNQDDGILDTPSQFEASNGCNTFPLYDNCTTSGNGIMFQNYMDYSDDACMNLFTSGQRGMMRSTIFSARSTLVDALCDQESVLALAPTINLVAEKKNNEARILILINSIEKPHSLILEKSNDLMSFQKIYESSDFKLVNGIWTVRFVDSKLNALNFYKSSVFLKDGSVLNSRTEVIDQTINSDDLKIYPNPAIESIKIENLQDDRLYSVSIFNMLGTCVSKTSIGVNDNNVLLNTLPYGLYTIAVESQGMIQAKRIILGRR